MRTLAVAAVAFIVLTPMPLPVWPGRLFPVSQQQHALLMSGLKWFVALCIIREINAALNWWAENKWMWTTDKKAWVWRNEVAVVTGGSKGIGAIVVRKLVSYGIKVAVLDVEPLSTQVKDLATMVHFYQCDIGSRTAVHKAGEAIRSDHGPPSILINNAGIGNANSILDVSPERLRTIFDVNLLSHWHIVQEFLPDMITKRKGHVLGVASMAAFLGMAGMVDYGCTKAGLTVFYEGLGQELKHRYNCPEIKTSIVYPYWTRTRMTQMIEKGIHSTGAPMVEPENVAEAIVKQIIKIRSGQIVLGPSLSVFIRALPTWLQEFIRDRVAQVVTVNASTAVS